VLRRDVHDRASESQAEVEVEVGRPLELWAGYAGYLTRS
jgi:hypothetical protein